MLLICLWSYYFLLVLVVFFKVGLKLLMVGCEWMLFILKYLRFVVMIKVFRFMVKNFFILL